MSELCDVPQRHDLLRSSRNDAAKGDEDDALCMIDLHSSVVFFFFFFGNSVFVAKVAMIYRSI